MKKMKETKRPCRPALVVLVAMLSVSGCHNGDDNDVFEVPVDQQVEAGLNQALNTTVVPLVTFMGTVADLLSSPFSGAVAGIGCPDTSGWCSSGTAACSVTAEGLSFDFSADSRNKGPFRFLPEYGVGRRFR